MTVRFRSRTDALQPEHSVNYSYDAMNRLTQAGAVNGSWSIAWTLDAWGNRTAQTPGGLATSLVGSQTLGYSNNRNTLFSYDNAGNVTNDGLHTYLYDAEGQITSVDGGAVTFGYDTEGRRVKKTASSQTTYYFYGRTGLLSEFTTVNTGTTQAQSTDRLNYVVSEQTGTPVLMLAGSGTVLENNRVLPFGELWSSQTASANDQKFTTYLRDQETGNDYAMARFYASRYGRFMSADLSGANIDLADPQSWNAYAYVNGDPIDFTDPSGEGFWSKLLGIGLSIAGFFTGGTTTLLGTILTTSGSALTGASLALGQPSVSGTPPFNPSAQGAPVGVFGTPPFGGTGNSPIPTGGVFQPPVIVQPQLIFDAQAPYITGVINAYERALPSWLPTWARTLLVGIFSDPTPGLFAMEVPIPGRPFIGLMPPNVHLNIWMSSMVWILPRPAIACTN